MQEVFYKTNFNLEWPVNDFDAAQNYLQEDNMTEYLLDSLHDDGKFSEDEIAKIKHIEWNLRDEQSGYILLTATEVLSNVMLDAISDWVSGQNSDGLGEGFEQQPFAEYIEENDYGYEDDEYYQEDNYHMASFDWQNNDYKFKRISTPNAIHESYHVKRIDEI